MGLPNAYEKATIILQDTTTLARATVTLWYKMDTGTPPVAGDMPDCANDFVTAFSTAVPAVLPTACSMMGVHYVHKAGSILLDAYSNTTPIAGTVSGDYLPERAAVVVRRKTGTAGANNRGRIFWPFIPETYQNKGALSAGGITVYAALRDMIANPITVGTMTLRPQNVSFKTSALVPVVYTELVTEIYSRRDRTYPKYVVPIPSPP